MSKWLLIEELPTSKLPKARFAAGGKIFTSKRLTLVFEDGIFFAMD